MLMPAFGTGATAAADLVSEDVQRSLLFKPSNGAQNLPTPLTAAEFVALGLDAADHAWGMQEAAAATFAADSIGSTNLTAQNWSAGAKPVAGQPAVGIYWNDSHSARTAWELRDVEDQLNSNVTSTYDLDNAWSIFGVYRTERAASGSLPLCGNLENFGSVPGWRLDFGGSGDLNLKMYTASGGSKIVQVSGVNSHGDGAWHYFLISNDGVGNISVKTSVGSISTTTPSLTAYVQSTEGMSYGTHNGINTQVAIQFAYGCAWETDQSANHDAIAAALWNMEALPGIGVAGESVTYLTDSTIRRVTIDFDEAFGEYVATRGYKQFLHAYDTAAIDASDAPGWYSGDAVTNRVLRSESTASWSTSGSWTISNWVETSPSGQIRAGRFTEAAGGSTLSIGATTSLASTYCLSVFMRAAGDASMTFDVIDSLSNVISTKSINLTTAWKRYHLVGVAADAFTSMRFERLSGSAEFHVWGAQVEVGAGPGMYVQTIGSAATSQPGDLSYLFDAGEVLSSKGTMEALFTCTEDDHTQTRTLCNVDQNDTTNDSQTLFEIATSEDSRFKVFDESGVQLGAQTGGVQMNFDRESVVRCSWDSDQELPQESPNTHGLRQRHLDGSLAAENATITATGVVLDNCVKFTPGASRSSVNKLRGIIKKIEFFSVPMQLTGG